MGKCVRVVMFDRAADDVAPLDILHETSALPRPRQEYDRYLGQMINSISLLQ